MPTQEESVNPCATELVVFLSGIPLDLFRSEAEGLLVVREAGLNVLVFTREIRSLVKVVHRTGLGLLFTQLSYWWSRAMMKLS